jgi:hypothetical protein
VKREGGHQAMNAECRESDPNANAECRNHETERSIGHQDNASQDTEEIFDRTDINLLN